MDIEITSYGLLCMIGIGVAAVIGLLLARHRKYEFFDFMLVVVITLLSALAGAKILSIIVNWNLIVNLFEVLPAMEALEIVIRSGFVFYGGLIGGVIGLFITCKVKKVSFIEYASVFGVPLCIGHAFGRVGCFLGGCCYGIEYDGILSHVYETAIDASTPIGVPLLPIQLIEAVLLMLLFSVLLFVFLKLNNSKLVLYLYALSYSVIRFVLEFFRGDAERGSLFSISTSQWISMIIFSVAVILLVIETIKRIKNKRQTTNVIDK